MNNYAQLYLTFLKLGAITFGGGLAMLPILHQEVTVRRGWTSEEELIDIYAVAQCAPGIIAVNTATYVGCHVAGPTGGIAAVLGLVTSPIALMTLAMLTFRGASGSPLFQHALNGVGAMVCVLLTNTVWTMARKSIKDRLTAAICVAALLLAIAFDLPILVLTLGGGTLGLLYGALTGRWRS